MIFSAHIQQHKMFSPSTTDIPTNSDNSSMVILYSLVGGINLI